jgi:hypothetical protein
MPALKNPRHEAFAQVLARGYQGCIQISWVCLHRDEKLEVGA